MEKFSYEEKGYNREEVNQFIDDVIKETEAIVLRAKSQRLEIERLNNELEHYKEQEKNIRTSIEKAEETSDKIRQLAREESELIISEAKSNASRIINDALVRAEKIQTKKETLEKNIEIFKNKLRNVMKQQTSIIEYIDELELDDNDK